MWDNPRLLNLAANALYGAAAVIVLCILIIAALNSRLFPMRTVSVQGELTHIDAAMVEQALAGRVAGNFFGVDLAAVRAALLEVPWARRVEVRRQWPDRLVVRIEEHEALAHWSETQLVNQQGEIFPARSAGALPRFAGPEGSARLVTARYHEFSRMVAPLGMEIASIELSARRAWQVELRGEDERRLTLVLGRELEEGTVSARLQRFVAVYPQTLGALNRRTGYVDLRYPNGFALRVPGLEKLQSQNKKQGSA